MDIIHSYASKVPAGYRKLQLEDVAVTVDLPSGTTRITIQAEGKSIRYRDDGRAPTANDGMAIANGAAPFDLYSVTDKLRIISQTFDVGANATATLDITAANGDLTFTAPAVGDEYNGTQFVADSQGAESVTYNVNTDVFTLNYNAATSNGSSMKTVFDAAITANPTWPQWACAIEGNGNGVWAIGDDGANATSSNGADPVGAIVHLNFYRDSEL